PTFAGAPCGVTAAHPRHPRLTPGKDTDGAVDDGPVRRPPSLRRSQRRSLRRGDPPGRVAAHAPTCRAVPVGARGGGGVRRRHPGGLPPPDTGFQDSFRLLFTRQIPPRVTSRASSPAPARSRPVTGSCGRRGGCAGGVGSSGGSVGGVVGGGVSSIGPQASSSSTSLPLWSSAVLKKPNPGPCGSQTRLA